MASGELILSPVEKKLAEPLLNWLVPERITGKKELVINHPGEIGLESYEGTWEFHKEPLLTLDALTGIMNLLADRTNQTYNMANPILSVKLPGGHRAQFVAGQQNAQKFSLCVRLANEREFTLESYVMEPEQRNDLVNAVQTRNTVLISGGTGTGKTSFMNALMKYIPMEDRLVILEDVPELRFNQNNVVHFLFANFAKGQEGGRVAAVNELLNATLRMRPDRIIMGEIRKENAFTFCSAINTGHQGSMATVHANTPEGAIDAVINRVMLNGDTTESALQILQRQLAGDIAGVVQLERVGPKVHARWKRFDQKPV
ncbi:MAG: Flp pilus assembly complex ATPase component TadA [Pseudomonadaceae bacterium]|nr:Flp pilus assembly complex ATPase component TadA [Pseudomonadaceae bacterium]